jgi:hypothetical protein
MKNLLPLLIAAAGLLPATAQTTPYYIAGDFNSWNAAGNVMTQTSSGVWQVTLTGLSAGRHEFKVTEGDWSWNYPGANSWLYAPADGTITLTYDVNTYADGWSPTSQRIGESADPGAWTAVGNFNSWNNAAGNMIALGGGLYEYQITAAGSYTWKAVVTGTWDSISWDNRSIATSDWGFTVNSGETANLYVDALKGVVKVEILTVPEPSALALLGTAFALLLRRRR